MKKKQKDFQKVKLKVGKRLPKGRNETRTSFQTRKINIREQIKGSTGDPTLKELLSFMKSTDVKTKFENLRRIAKFVSDHNDTLSMFFPLILKELGRQLQESDPKIRSEAISVLGKCAKNLTDLQIRPFVVPLTSYLSCMMTHISFQVKQDSLKFLDTLINSHCTVICQSHEILFYLLNMISQKDSSAVKGDKKNKRKLLDVINNKVTAEEWRTNVLERILSFLTEILLKEEPLMNFDDQNKVQWDNEEKLHVPIYPYSGVKPAEIYSLYCPVNSEGCDSEAFRDFVIELRHILSAILKGQLKQYFSPNIKYLSIITQIVCCTGEWSIKNVDLHYESGDLHNLITICRQLLKFFPCSLPATESRKADEIQCVPLNLQICYLYCMCSFLVENADKSYFDSWDEIKLYIAKVFSVSGARLNEKSISLCIKICKIVVKCKNFDDLAKNGILVALLGTLDIIKLSPAATGLYSFFMNLSFENDNKDLLMWHAMREWFRRLIENLCFMVESKKFAPNYINYIKQVCLTKNIIFMESLNSLPSEKFKDFLNFDDEELQLTAMHLILSLEKISSDLLQDLAEIIRNKSFSLKMATKIIRFLHSRFSNSGVPLEDQIHFVKFLLNVSCDTSLILNPTFDIDPLPLKKALIDLQQDFGCFRLMYPTSDFERHHKVLQVCLNCLVPYIKNDIQKKYVLKFFLDILTGSKFIYPVHSVVASIEIIKRFKDSFYEHVFKILPHFIYSCLLYSGFITEGIPEENWIEYCIPAIDGCLDIIEPKYIISLMDNSIDRLDEAKFSLMMKILQFLMNKQSLKDRHFIVAFFNKMSELHFEQRIEPCDISYDEIEYVEE